MEKNPGCHRFRKCPYLWWTILPQAWALRGGTHLDCILTSFSSNFNLFSCIDELLWSNLVIFERSTLDWDNVWSQSLFVAHRALSKEQRQQHHENNCKMVSMGWWFLRLTVKRLAILRLRSGTLEKFLRLKFLLGLTIKLYQFYAYSLIFLAVLTPLRPP